MESYSCSLKQNIISNQIAKSRDTCSNCNHHQILRHGKHVVKWSQNLSPTSITIAAPGRGEESQVKGRATVGMLDGV